MLYKLENIVLDFEDHSSVVTGNCHTILSFSWKYLIIGLLHVDCWCTIYAFCICKRCNGKDHVLTHFYGAVIGRDVGKHHVYSSSLTYKSILATEFRQRTYTLFTVVTLAGMLIIFKRDTILFFFKIPIYYSSPSARLSTVPWLRTWNA